MQDNTIHIIRFRPRKWLEETTDENNLLVEGGLVLSTEENENILLENV